MSMHAVCSENILDEACATDKIYTVSISVYLSVHEIKLVNRIYTTCHFCVWALTQMWINY